MADRIAVMHEGHIRHIFSGEEATPEAIVTAATGATPAPISQAALHRAAFA